MRATTEVIKKSQMNVKNCRNIEAIPAYANIWNFKLKVKGRISPSIT